MWRNLFSIMIRPGQVLNDLIFENDLGSARKATRALALVDTLYVFLLLVGYSILFLAAPHVIDESFEGWPGMVLVIILVVGTPLAFVISWLFHTLARYLFMWFVRAGLRISAGSQYPQERAERQEKGRLLQVIQPYTAAINWIPSQAMQVVYYAVLLGGAVIAEASGNIAMMVTAGAGVLIGLLNMVVTLGTYIYMIVVRVQGIGKIYGISASRAFWGPFLIYFLVSIIPFILIISTVLIFAMTSEMTY